MVFYYDENLFILSVYLNENLALFLYKCIRGHILIQINASLDTI